MPQASAAARARADEEEGDAHTVLARGADEASAGAARARSADEGSADEAADEAEEERLRARREEHERIIQRADAVFNRRRRCALFSLHESPSCSSLCVSRRFCASRRFWSL